MDNEARSRLLVRSRKVGATALVAGGLVAGSFGVAAATTGSSSGSSSGSTPAPSHPGWGGPRGMGGPGAMGGPRGMGGTVTAVSPTSLTVSRPDGTPVTYTLTSSTTYQKDRAASTYAALAVGERVAVRTSAPPSSSSTTPATAVEVDIVSPHLGGVVQSVSTSGSASTIVVADAQGFWRTIITSASTTYTDNGSSVSSPTITKGEFVNAAGSIDANHTTLDATSVAIGKPTPPARP